MRLPICRLLFALIIAVSTAGLSAFAQTPDPASAMLPVWNSEGQVEGALILEPADGAASAKLRFGSATLSTAFGLDAGDSLGLLCNNRNGVAHSIGGLISTCNVAMLGDSTTEIGTQHLTATTTLANPVGKLGVSVGSGQGSFPAWMAPLNADTGRFKQNDLAVFGQKNLGSEGFVAIGGAIAHARLVPLSELPNIPDQWTSKSVGVAAGYGPFSANIVGRVVDVPGQPGKWEGVGVGLTWHTPWSGQLTVGAENIVTNGKNPFAPDAPVSVDGTVPYVRYEQDL